MRTWLTACQNDHPKCRIPNPSVGPSRLLDVDADFSRSNIRLVEIKEGSVPFPFVCLSHCWGPAHALVMRTTKANLDAHKKLIALDELSETFKDAIRITRDLGYRYLWIDSLCIVQDDRDDWAREAQNMPDIYGASTLTIAALSSADGFGGCRTGADDTKQRVTWRRVDVVNPEGHVRFFEQNPTYWYKEYGDNPYKRESFGQIHCGQEHGHCKKESSQ